MKFQNLKRITAIKDFKCQLTIKTKGEQTLGKLIYWLKVSRERGHADQEVRFGCMHDWVVGNVGVDDTQTWT